MGLPRMVPSLFTELCVLLLLAKGIYIRLFILQKPIKIPGFYPMLGLFIVSLFSYLINMPNILPAIFFLRKTFIYYFFFVALSNLDLDEETITKINKYVPFLFLMQIPAAAIKYLCVGIDEYWIGTISWQAGQLSTTFPLFVIGFLLAFYLFTKEKKYILLIMAFIFFGLAGQKRALAILLPVVFFLGWYLYGKRTILKMPLSIKFSRIKTIFLILIISLSGIFFSSKFLQSEMYSGKADIRKIIEYIKWYNTRDQIALYGDYNPDHTMGRITITKKALNRIKNGGLIRMLIGFGPGEMILSPHLGRSQWTAYEAFGIHGALTGFVTLVLQTGFLGVAFLTYFLLSLFRYVYNLYQKSMNTNFKILALGFLLATFVFVMDFYIYSESTLFFGILTPIYYYIATLLVQEKFHDSQISQTVTS